MDDKVRLKFSMKVSFELDLENLVKRFAIDENDIAEAIECEDEDAIQNIIDNIPNSIGGLFQAQIGHDVKPIDLSEERIQITVGDRTLITTP